MATTKNKYRKIRNAAGLNQKQFWQRVGITQSGGSRYETGRPVPMPVQILVDLAYGSETKFQATLKRLRKRPRPAAANGSQQG